MVSRFDEGCGDMVRASLYQRRWVVVSQVGGAAAPTVCLTSGTNGTQLPHDVQRVFDGGLSGGLRCRRDWPARLHAGRRSPPSAGARTRRGGGSPRPGQLRQHFEERSHRLVHWRRTRSPLPRRGGKHWLTVCAAVVDAGGLGRRTQRCASRSWTSFSNSLVSSITVCSSASDRRPSRRSRSA